jgi:hypothetical protein
MKEKEICIEVDEGLYNEILEIRGRGYGLVDSQELPCPRLLQAGIY